MFIKKLEMSGFKSFADRTTVDLMPGINCVVGPNGCGKSNILDAIRWVLGEQKYSLMRSKTSEEVIFAGTGKRSPHGLAQVNVVFDNEDGLIPVDEPEVSISRRFFREGVGQFKLNGKNVRLRDIHEMLADTGVGSGALFILSNQEIDRILSPNSNERRSILEETAGVNKYQLRKKETLRKLQSTRENIARLNDILQEVARQLEISQKQLKRLEKYRKVKSRLSQLEIELIHRDTELVKKQQAELLEMLEKLKSEKDELALKIERQEFVKKSKSDELEQLGREMEREREALQKVNLEEEKLRGNVDLIGEKIRQAKATLSEYHQGSARIEKRMGEIQERIDRDHNNVNNVKDNSQKIELDLETTRKEYELAKGEFGKVEARINRDRERIRKTSEEIELLDMKRTHARQVLESTRREMERHLASHKNRNRDVEQSRENIAKWKARIQELNVESEKARAHLESAAAKEKSLREESEKAREKARSLRENIQESQSELAAIIREEENFRGFSSAYSSLMRQKSRMPELTPVYSVLKVDPEYETAADVVLGGHFQSIITRTKADADECIDFLKRERAGRLTFFPMDLSRTPPNLPVLPRGLPGMVGWARHLIKTGPAYQEILDQICGKTLVVENLDSAYAIYRKQKRDRGFVPRMVTLEGDVLDFSGAVTGGRYRVERSQVLSRGRRRQELEEALHSRGEHLEKMKIRVVTLDREMADAHRNNSACREQVEKLRSEENSLTQQLKVLETATSRAGQELENFEQAGTELARRIQDNETTLSDLEKSIGKLKNELEEVSAQTKRFENENSHFIERLNRLSDKTRLMENQLQENRGQLDLYQSRIESNSEFLRQNMRDTQEQKNRAESKEEDIKTLENQLQETHNKKSILSLKMRSLEKAVESTSGSFRKLHEEIKQAEEQAALLLGRQEKMRDSENELRIKGIELDSRMENLVRRRSEFPKELRQNAGNSTLERDRIQDLIGKNRTKLASFDDVNFSAQEEFDSNKHRHDFLDGQINDLSESVESLREIIREMDQASLRALEETIKLLNQRFGELFRKVFGGGKGSVYFSDPSNKLESGVEVEVQPPGKRPASINQLSTGEKSLTAVTLLFALLSIKPGPFVILDELDAPLDESNVEKIAGLIREFSEKSQFVVITHNRKTMEFADKLLGVTMQEPGVSRLVSVRFDDIDKFSGEKPDTVPIT